jgi:hypothetical protein
MTLALEPYLWSEKPVPEPISSLSHYRGEMLVWRLRQDFGRPAKDL